MEAESQHPSGVWRYARRRWRSGKRSPASAPEGIPGEPRSVRPGCSDQRGPGRSEPSELVLFTFDRTPQLRDATCVSEISESPASGHSHRGGRSMHSPYESRKDLLRVLLGNVVIFW